MTSTTTLERLSRPQQIRAILTDERYDRPTRLLRLQGWREDDLTAAVTAGSAHRLAPGFCAMGATLVAALGSSPVALVLTLTAVIGTFASNHPVETVYNELARRFGRGEIPPNRAAKRLACLLGTAFLGTSTLLILLGETDAGRIVAAAFAVVAWFVTVTNVCVPSLLSIMLFGVERSTQRRLL